MCLGNSPLSDVSFATIFFQAVASPPSLDVAFPEQKVFVKSGVYPFSPSWVVPLVLDVRNHRRAKATSTLPCASLPPPRSPTAARVTFGAVVHFELVSRRVLALCASVFAPDVRLLQHRPRGRRMISALSYRFAPPSEVSRHVCVAPPGLWATCVDLSVCSSAGATLTPTAAGGLDVGASLLQRWPPSAWSG